jgi:hypothetical protein
VEKSSNSFGKARTGGSLVFVGVYLDASALTLPQNVKTLRSHHHDHQRRCEGTSVLLCVLLRLLSTLRMRHWQRPGAFPTPVLEVGLGSWLPRLPKMLWTALVGEGTKETAIVLLTALLPPELISVRSNRRSFLPLNISSHSSFSLLIFSYISAPTHYSSSISI